jgi:hypothetical protein
MDGEIDFTKYSEDELLEVWVELTRFSGHLMVSFGGVRDGDQKCQVYAGV